MRLPGYRLSFKIAKDNDRIKEVFQAKEESGRKKQEKSRERA